MGFAAAALVGCGSGSEGGAQAIEDGSAPQDAAAAEVAAEGSPDGWDGAGGSGQDAGDGSTEAQAPLPASGVYEITGQDTRWGPYGGRAEIRSDGTVVHLQQWASAEFEGDKIGLAWEGKAEGLDEANGPYAVSFWLDRVGFIKTYKGASHANVTPATVGYTASCARKDFQTLECKFAPGVPSEPTYEELWTRQSDTAAEPIWRNERTLVPMHEPIPANVKASLFTTYKTFHELPEVAPYTSRPEFQEGMHYQVFDPTDFEFYRANPDVLRVIGKSPDEIALAETRMRNRAYRQTLEQKRAIFEAEMPLHHLNSAGMLVDYVPGGTPQWQPSGDSMLWTGVYGASQAMRYLVTKEQEAFDNMLNAVHAQVLCYDIVGQSGQFARTVREHQDPVGTWVQGTGAFAVYDWMPGCNNDMLQGYYVLFTWAYLVLKDMPGYLAEKQKMAAILDDLVENFPVAGDNETNELKARMILYWMTQDLEHKLTYEAIWQGAQLWLVDQGNGALWEYGTSDWSGNHLIIQGVLVPFLVSQNLNDGHLGDLKTAMRHALERMRHTRLGLYQQIAATLGDFASPPPELEESLWVLREFPAPKVNHDIDWRINPSFCMSPFPNLPWKNDWTTSNRFASLTAYTLFEKVPDIFAWKQGPFEFREGASPVQYAGTDFLFAYWFGRLTGMLTPQM